MNCRRIRRTDTLKKRRSFFGRIMHKWKKRRKIEMKPEDIDRNMKVLLELQRILTERKATLEVIVRF